MPDLLYLSKENRLQERPLPSFPFCLSICTPELLTTKRTFFVEDPISWGLCLFLIRLQEQPTVGSEQDFVFNILSELNRDPWGASTQSHALVAFPSWAAVYTSKDTFPRAILPCSLKGTDCTCNILPGEPHLQEVLACMAKCSKERVLRVPSNNSVPATLLSVTQA